jgi:hypothetical protein
MFSYRIPLKMTFSVFWLPSINIEKRKGEGKERQPQRGCSFPKKRVFLGGFIPKA